MLCTSGAGMGAYVASWLTLWRRHSYSGNSAHGFEDCDQFFPDNSRRARGAMPEMSGKFDVLARMLNLMRATTRDRIVLVSNYTQTLDLMVTMLRDMGYPYLRLDGSTSAAKRQKLVDKFNDFDQDQFAFLLSSKAGGCGLNLVGGNRLILFDPDWNVRLPVTIGGLLSGSSQPPSAACHGQAGRSSRLA